MQSIVELWLNKIINVIICIVTVCSTVALMLCFLCVVYVAFDQGLWNIEYANIPYSNINLLNAFMRLIIFYVALITLKKWIDIETINSLANLRKMLNSTSNRQIHKELICESDAEEVLSIDELDYLGTIELGAIMHRKGALSDKEFYNQFGYRVNNVLNSKIYDVIAREAHYYKDFQYIVGVVRRYTGHNEDSASESVS